MKPRSGSSRKPVSPPDATRAVVDTVILRYFYVVGQADLLFALLGEPLLVPRIVFNPDEEAKIPERVMSEITRSIFVQQMRSNDPRRDKSERALAADHAARLDQVAVDQGAGRIEVVDLTPAETETFAKLGSRGDPLGVGLAFALDPGEAACVAISVERKLVLATDDGDGLKAFRALRPKGRYERIRKLLKRAGESGLVEPAEANAIHQAMCGAGFWDKGQPFRGA